MKVLLATKRSVGRISKKLDFCHATESELVTYGSECDGERWNGGCGCKRALVGLVSRKATVAFEVADRPEVTESSLRDAVRAHLLEGGWIGDSEKDDEEFVKGLLTDTIRLYSSLAHVPSGTVVGRKGSKFYVRESIRRKAA